MPPSQEDVTASDLAAARNLPEFSRDGIRRWLASLSALNFEQSLSHLSAALSTLAGHEHLAPALHLELAELLRGPVLRLTERHRSQCVDLALPYAGEIGALLRRDRQVHEILLRIYSKASLEPVDTGGHGRSERVLALGLYRALQQSGQVLLWTTQDYGRVGSAFWRQLYRLYRLAETHKLLDTRFDDPEEPESCRTPGAQFKRVVLFFLADARRLRQDDMSRLYFLLGRLGDLAELGDKPVRSGVPAEFVLMLDTQQAPLRLRSITGDGSQCLRFLATEGLTRCLLESAVPGLDRPDKRDLDRVALGRVAASLGAASKRRTSRIAEARDCRYVFGLAEVAASMPAPPDRLQPVRRPEEPARPPWSMPTGDGFELMPVEGGGGGANLGNPQPVGRPAPAVGGSPGLSLGSGPTEGILFETAHSPGDIWRRRPEPAASAERFEGRLVSSGAQGFCVVWSTAQRARARVGEVLALWAEAAPFIGVIRWLESRAEGLRFGMELLAPTASAVRVSDSTGHHLGPGLLLPADPVLRSLPELLAPPGAARAGAILTLHTGESSYSYKVREFIEATGSFDRCGVVQLIPKLHFS